MWCSRNLLYTSGGLGSVGAPAAKAFRDLVKKKPAWGHFTLLLCSFPGHLKCLLVVASYKGSENELSSKRPTL